MTTMTVKKFVRLHITASHDEELPIEMYSDEGGEMSQVEIEEWADENAAEVLIESNWAMWDIDVQIVEREVPDSDAE